MIQGFQRVSEFGNIGNNMIRKLFDSAIPFLREVQTSVPTTDSLPEGWGCFYSSSETYRIYFNIEGTIKYIGLGLSHIQNTDTHLGTIDANIDFNGHQGLGFVIENRTNDTGCTQTGRVWFRTD